MGLFISMPGLLVKLHQQTIYDLCYIYIYIIYIYLIYVYNICIYIYNILSEGSPLHKLYVLLDAGEPGKPDANRIIRSFWGMMTQLGSGQVILAFNNYMPF